MYSSSYRAPEVWINGVYDGKADVFALGCTLAEVVGGRPIFRPSRRADDDYDLWQMLERYNADGSFASRTLPKAPDRESCEGIKFITTRPVGRAVKRVACNESDIASESLHKDPLYVDKRTT